VSAALFVIVCFWPLAMVDVSGENIVAEFLERVKQSGGICAAGKPNAYNLSGLKESVLIDECDYAVDHVASKPVAAKLS
jgi:hypothetical protein